MIKASVSESGQLALRLAETGARRGQTAAVRAAEELREEAAALAPGRLGAVLRAQASGDGAEVTAPPHARFVEFGTRKMAARPFLRPAIERVRAMLRV